MRTEAEGGVVCTAGGGGAPGQGMRAPPEAGEGLEITSCLEPPEGTSPEFSPPRLILDFQPPELQGINVLFQATASWSLVIVEAGNGHTQHPEF